MFILCKPQPQFQSMSCTMVYLDPPLGTAWDLKYSFSSFSTSQLFATSSVIEPSFPILTQPYASGNWSLSPLLKAKDFLQLLSFHGSKWESNIQLEKCICTRAGLAGPQVDPDLLTDIFSNHIFQVHLSTCHTEWCITLKKAKQVITFPQSSAVERSDLIWSWGAMKWHRKHKKIERSCAGREAGLLIPMEQPAAQTHHPSLHRLFISHRSLIRDLAPLSWKIYFWEDAT